MPAISYRAQTGATVLVTLLGLSFWLSPTRAEAQAPATFSVSIEAPADQSWRATALEDALREDLEGHRGLTQVSAGADLEVRGTLTPTLLTYRVLTEVHRSELRELELVGLEPRALFRDARAAVDDLVSASRSSEPTRPRDSLGLFAVLSILAGLPLLLGVFAWTKLSGSARRRLLLVPAIPVVAASIWAGLRPPGFVLAIAGGLAWGHYGYAVLRSMLPPIGGFDKAPPRQLFRMVGLWTMLAVSRGSRTVLVHGTVMAALWWACSAADSPTGLTVALALPIGGLLVRLTARTCSDLVASGLDSDLVVGSPGADNPWHQAVRGYLTGYMRRMGWTEGAALTERTLFLPGNVDEILVYGGGNCHARIVIPLDMLEMALAPYGRPHDYAPVREDKLHWTEWNAGLVVPATDGVPLASRAQRVPQIEIDYSESEHIPLGQPPTLAGFVEPSALDPRSAHQPGEDPLWLSWQSDEEHDGTDASDRDFLFGAVLRELGVVRRDEGTWLTLEYAGATAASRLPRRFAELLSAGRRLVSRGVPVGDIAADLFASLNHGHHHLVQYLSWRAWKRETRLTARAHAPTLERRTSQIYADLEAEQPADAANLVARLRWLATTRSESRSSPRSRRWALGAAFALAAAVWLALGITRAIYFHPTYQERTSHDDSN